eukprot:6411801-Prorocentrum_lima.AAC.1
MRLGGVGYSGFRIQQQSSNGYEYEYRRSLWTSRIKTRLRSGLRCEEYDIFTVSYTHLRAHETRRHL